MHARMLLTSDLCVIRFHCCSRTAVTVGSWRNPGLLVAEDAGRCILVGFPFLQFYTDSLSSSLLPVVELPQSYYRASRVETTTIPGKGNWLRPHLLVFLVQTTPPKHGYRCCWRLK